MPEKQKFDDVVGHCPSTHRFSQDCGLLRRLISQIERRWPRRVVHSLEFCYLDDNIRLRSNHTIVPCRQEV